MILIYGAMIVGEDEYGPYLIEPGYVGIQKNTIAYVGTEKPKGYESAELIKATNGLVIPGFIDLHYHADSPMTKGFVEDEGSPHFGGSGLYEYFPEIYAATDEEDWIALTRLTLAEMVRGGITTCVEFNSYFPEDLAILLGEIGMRGYISPEVNSLKLYPYSKDGLHIVIDEETPDRAFHKLERNLSLIETINEKNPEGLVFVTLGPTEPPACNAELLKQVRQYANQMQVPITMHAAETQWEVEYIRERYHCTSIEFLDSCGITGPDVILGHAIFTTPSDIKRLAQTQTSVAHCPTIFARKGVLLRSLQKYLDAGINVGIGTDTFPQDMIREMRMANLCCRVADQDYRCGSSIEVFKCATTRGAQALGRTDLGKIQVGAKADIAIVNMADLNMVPVRDPIKVLVSCGCSMNVETTIINGKVIMLNRQLLRSPWEEIIESAQMAATRVWKKAKRLDNLSPYSIRRIP